MVGPTCTFITVYLVFDDHLRKAKFLWIIKRRNHSTNDFLVFLLRLRKITKETSLPKRYINLITLLELAENAHYLPENLIETKNCDERPSFVFGFHFQRKDKIYLQFRLN